MDKVLEIIKDKRVRFGVSFLSILYVYFVGFMTWLVFAYYIKPTNNVSIFCLYLFVNFMFAAEMVYTRKSIITKICAIIIPFEIFAMLIAGFGQWYIIIPPLVACMIGFFACNLAENCKMVLGTLFLLMYVVGSLAYVTLQNFNISLTYIITGDDLDMSLRQSGYLESPDGTYRLVTYVKTNHDRTTTSYYVEEAEKDMHFWFVDCYYTHGCQKVLTTVYQNDLNPSWVSDTELLIDGKIRDIPQMFVEEEETEEETTTSAETTLAEETASDAEENQGESDE